MKSHIVVSAEQVFDRDGFTATGVDSVAAAAGVSSRTLYKHVGSKSALVAAVLEQRESRFFGELDANDVDGLFAALEAWTIAVGTRGCLFFRAESETGGTDPAIAQAVESYRHNLVDLVRDLVEAEVGDRNSGLLSEQILVLIEGCVSAATYRGIASIRAARSAAATLIRNHLIAGDAKSQ
ncbi:TetR/AcrR family transcriptional regulator [Mycobacterium sp. 21AC1]|uniref:TetR/AcrR family transcriptional regulator n=1 Tax=[Mycobacterium] appelbergii TaxID=2939269 RepID=UPI0029394ACA|nr:TetR/AcrR family transcriptional regulator [Mycobacterium sp. 21AC1]MDV3128363.1 TetR/AcrR family transcriptional regulator [Mycobacterium sp. 21AC1]